MALDRHAQEHRASPYPHEADLTECDVRCVHVPVTRHSEALSVTPQEWQIAVIHIQTMKACVSVTMSL